MLKDILLPAGLRLRKTRVTDHAFIERLFGSVRQHLYSMPMPREYIDKLIAQQYRLQQDSYARQWPDAYTLIIERSRETIGKITLDEGANAVRIIDITLTPDARGRSYGTSILRAIQAEAGARGLAMELSVDRQNYLAKRLYLRLGFTVAGNSATHEAMTWQQGAEAADIAKNIMENAARIS